MSGKPTDADSEATDPTVGDAPTADLQTGEESSERLDAAFELLADPLRRAVLYRLAETGDARLDVSTLAAGVASTDPRADGADRTDAGSVAVELHHTHLPKLESHGVVAYDPERRTVEYRERTWLEEWLDHVRAEESA